jgi:hypothetical protein
MGGGQASRKRNATQSTTRISSIAAWRWAGISTPQLGSDQVLTVTAHVTFSASPTRSLTNVIYVAADIGETVMVKSS